MTPLEIALKEYGTKGYIGAINNPRVVNYFKEIGQSWVQDDETAWCAAFVNWCLKQSNKPYTGKLNARSFLDYGVSTKTPALGDLVVFWRINKAGPYGHVAFFIAETKNTVFVLGGNQQNRVQITEYEKEQVLDYRQIPLVGGK